MLIYSLGDSRGLDVEPGDVGPHFGLLCPGGFAVVLFRLVGFR